jgi:hypothetical protein
LAILATELFSCEALLTIRRPVLESGTAIGVRIAIKIFFLPIGDFFSNLPGDR